MKIFVQQLGGPEPWILDVDSQATLSDLKTLIRDANGIDDTVVLQLVLNETLFEANMNVLLEANMNATTLEEYGIEDGITLTIIKRPTPLVLTASDDSTAKIWDVSTGECKQTFSGHSNLVWSAVFSADGLSVLTASSDATAKIWDVSTGECKQTFSGHSSGVSSAVFSAGW